MAGLDRVGWREFSLLGHGSPPTVEWCRDWSSVRAQAPTVLVSISHQGDYAMATAVALMDQADASGAKRDDGS